MPGLPLGGRTAVRFDSIRFDSIRALALVVLHCGAMFATIADSPVVILSYIAIPGAPHVGSMTRPTLMELITPTSQVSAVRTALQRGVRLKTARGPRLEILKSARYTIGSFVSGDDTILTVSLPSAVNIVPDAPVFSGDIHFICFDPEPGDPRPGFEAGQTRLLTQMLAARVTLPMPDDQRFAVMLREALESVGVVADAGKYEGILTGGNGSNAIVCSAARPQIHGIVTKTITEWAHDG